MQVVLRAIITYLLLMMLFRLTGKRTLAQVTTFDFVLLLIVSECTQQAMISDDRSVTNGVLAIASLMVADHFFSHIGQKFKGAGKVLEGVPLVLVEHGRPFEDRLKHSRIEITEVLDAAREHHGLERLEQIKYAILERTGGISIIPEREGRLATGSSGKGSGAL
ncbi:MAG TPA: YetF domain-containing protein [Phycisphaerales bacterium]|nr:YetF domain-containing protein [Phycisphaerales bacterium]